MIILKQGILKYVISMSFKSWIKHCASFRGSNWVKSVIVTIHRIVSLKLKHVGNIREIESTVCYIENSRIPFFRIGSLQKNYCFWLVSLYVLNEQVIKRHVLFLAELKNKARSVFFRWNYWWVFKYDIFNMNKVSIEISWINVDDKIIKNQKIFKCAVHNF